MKPTIQGQIIAAFGRQYLARLEDGSELACLTRGKKSEVVCGDRVEIKLTGEASTENEAQGVIERIAPRRSLLHRSDAFREKLIAANVTQIIVVVAAEPSFSDELLARCLVAAYDQKLDVLIVLNKCDLAEAAAAARKRLIPYTTIGYRVLELSAKQDVAQLRPFLAGHTSVLVGQSGMGKSTLTNALVPNIAAATREISTALDSGKHTTTYARMYHLPPIPAGGRLIDCPGVQEFGLAHMNLQEIEACFIEFRPLLGTCRFRDCRHLAEPGCAIKAAAASGAIHPRRLAHYRQLAAEASRA